MRACPIGDPFTRNRPRAGILQGWSHHGSASNGVREIREPIPRRTGLAIFLPLSRFAENYYGQKTAFGEAVAEKFPEASEDIENAGNCLAVGQNAACVFHLMRAMEVVVQKYARRFGLRADLNVTWVVLASNMATKVEFVAEEGCPKHPQKGEVVQCRFLLRHVESHGGSHHASKKTYTSSQALTGLQRGAHLHGLPG